MKNNNFTNLQLFSLVALRWLIAWHFLYEGLIKIGNPAWTARNYLASAEWLFSGFFRSVALNDTLMQVVDFMNIWGLVLIGVGLFLGFMSKYASYAGILLLLLYYIAHPPLFGNDLVPLEGSYIIVNKNLIEAAALAVVALFPTSHIIGLERLIRKIK
ncbi:MAG: DoxX family membrane protein [Bacteroidales bacterium]|nr:DoxX family membrane protein [Bacteroidales bacterium]